MNIFSKDHHGYHMELLGVKLSLLKTNNSGWSGVTHSYRVRFLNDRLDYARSYWISVGRRIHSRSLDLNGKTQYITEHRRKLQERRIKSGNYMEN